MLFTADHNGFYQDGRPFFPLVQDSSTLPAEWADIAVVRLPARLQDNLDWSQVLEMAQKSSKYLLWEIDLGLDHYLFDPQDSAAFFSFTLALEEFSTKVWPLFKDRTFGVILYRGAFDPSFSFPFSKWEPHYSEWMEEMGHADYALYCAQNLAEYLHRLVSFLPDAVLPFAMLDVSSIPSPGKCAQLFSKERFEHTHLILKGASCSFSGITWSEGQIAQGWMGDVPRNKREVLPPPLGIYLPKDRMINPSILGQLDALIDSLNEMHTPFRIVSEEKLTEQWDGLDRLIVPAQAISAQGRRKLLGFIAAGGTVATYDDPEKIVISF